jgi:hypothetical protein
VQATPNEAAVEEYFTKNAVRYAKPGRVSFRHVYFSKTKQGAESETAASEALDALAKGVSDESLQSEDGPPFYPPTRRRHLEAARPGEGEVSARVKCASRLHEAARDFTSETFPTYEATAANYRRD